MKTGFDRRDMDVALEDVYNPSSTCPGAYIDAAREVLYSHSYYDRGGWNHGAPDVNLIELAADFDLTSVIERMDFGLCQISFDGQVVHWTEDYERDKANRRFTLTRGETPQGFERSMKRFERLSVKYEGWSLVVPARFQHLSMMAWL